MSPAETSSVSRPAAGPLVSAIMIFWNEERFIGEAIESVLAQSYENWELFLVDDGSEDQSTPIARDYASRFPEKIRYFEHPGHDNRGMSASRNLGIGRAGGRYLAFLDSDDVWLPDKLAHQVGMLEERVDVAMVYGPTQFWYSWSLNPDDRGRDAVVPVGETGPFEPPALLTCYLVASGTVPGICSLLVRRETVQAVGGFEEAFRGAYEDQVFLAKVCLRYRVLVDDHCSARYRQHPRSSTTLARQRGEYDPVLPHRARKIYLNWLAAHIASSGAEDSQLLAALSRALQPYRHPFVHGLPMRLRHSPELIKSKLEWVVQRTVLANLLRRLAARWRGREFHPRVGDVRFGSFGRVEPVSRVFGYDRGLPIDRHYAEAFLSSCEEDVFGRTLETGSPSYSLKFGGCRVTTVDVLHLEEGNPLATMTGDLTSAAHIPSDSYDCVLLTQTLQFIFDLRAAIRTVHRILRPGGVLLATFPGISAVGSDPRSAGWCWSLTSLSARRLLEERFPGDSVRIEAFGNVLSASGFLAGLAAQELDRAELDHRDPRYEVIVGVRAVKPRQNDERAR